MLNTSKQRNTDKFDMSDPQNFLMALTAAKPTERVGMLAEWQAIAEERGSRK
jgi:hypothetical protein